MTATKNASPFAGLTADVLEEKIAAKRGTGETNPYKRLEGTPFEGWLTKSIGDDKAMRVTVKTADDAKKVAQLLRLAAKKAGIGVRIPEPFEANPAGGVYVKFQGKPKTERKFSVKPSKPRKGETAAEFKARVDAWVAETGKTWTPPKKTEKTAETPAETPAAPAADGDAAPSNVTANK